MRSEQFWPGDKVMTVDQHEEIPRGTPGVILSRWLGTVYAVRLRDGTIHWMDSSELEFRNPSRHTAGVSDFVTVISDKHQHGFAKPGDSVQILKIIENADFYKVKLNDKIFWVPGFKLAQYL